MNYGRILASAYSWLSLSKVIWFLVFFWLSIPVLMFLPQVVQNGAYSPSLIPLIYGLYDLLYLALIIGIVFLIQDCFHDKKLKVPTFGLLKVVKTFLLVFVEMFYIFVWNLHARFRLVQILLLIASAVLAFYYSLVQSGDLLFAFTLCFAAYLMLVIYNIIRVFFSTSVFFSKEIGLKDAVKGSWDITHGKFYDTACALGFSILIAFIIFCFISLALGLITTLVLGFFFINSVATDLGFRFASLFALAPAIVAYHYAMSEVFFQLRAHKSSSMTVKRILARKVLSKGHSLPVRKFAKKKKRR